MRTMIEWPERDVRDAAEAAIPTGSRRAMLRTLLGGAGGIALVIGAAATVEAGRPPVLGSGWRRCTQCRGLVRGPDDLPCAAGGVHRLDMATTYALAFGFGEEPPPNHETGWRRCTACGLLTYLAGGPCPATGANHTPNNGEATYHIEYNQPPDSDEQTGWRYCDQCEALFRPKRRQRGACPAGGKHEVYPGYKYNLYLSF